jgi:hypothetical protein
MFACWLFGLDIGAKGMMVEDLVGSDEKNQAIFRLNPSCVPFLLI